MKRSNFLSSDPLGIRGPVAPLEFLGDDGPVAVANDFEFLIFFVQDFQKHHPAELFETLGVAGDAAILAHDVANIFDDGRDIGHVVRRPHRAAW